MLSLADFTDLRDSQAAQSAACRHISVDGSCLIGHFSRDAIAHCPHLIGDPSVSTGVPGPGEAEYPTLSFASPRGRDHSNPLG